MKVVFALGVLWLCACSDGARAPADRDAGESSFDAPTIALSGSVNSYQLEPTSEGRPAAALVCRDAPRRCTTSFPDGRWMLDGLEPEQEILLTFEVRDYLTALRPLVTPAFSTDIGTTSLIPLELSDQTGAEIDAARVEAGLPELEWKTFAGSLSFGARLSDYIAFDRSVHVTLEPETGSEPAYLMTNGPGWALEIPEDDTAALGSILNLPPRDDYALVYAMDDGDCFYSPSQWGGWPAHDGRANVIRVPVRADATTYATAPRCVRE